MNLSTERTVSAVTVITVQHVASVPTHKCHIMVVTVPLRTLQIRPIQTAQTAHTQMELIPTVQWQTPWNVTVRSVPTSPTLMDHATETILGTAQVDKTTTTQDMVLVLPVPI